MTACGAAAWSEVARPHTAGGRAFSAWEDICGSIQGPVWMLGAMMMNVTHSRQLQVLAGVSRPSQAYQATCDRRLPGDSTPASTRSWIP